MSKAVAERGLKLVYLQLQGRVRNVANIIKSEGLTSGVVNRFTMARAIKKEAAAQGMTLRACMGKPDKRLNQNTIAARLAFCTA